MVISHSFLYVYQRVYPMMAGSIAKDTPAHMDLLKAEWLLCWLGTSSSSSLLGVQFRGMKETHVVDSWLLLLLSLLLLLLLLFVLLVMIIVVIITIIIVSTVTVIRPVLYCIFSQNFGASCIFLGKEKVLRTFLDQLQVPFDGLSWALAKLHGNVMFRPCLNMCGLLNWSSKYFKSDPQVR